MLTHPKDNARAALNNIQTEILIAIREKEIPKYVGDRLIQTIIGYKFDISSGKKINLL